ncbi:Hypothetical protein A7982_01087 [Minicystis rosea]|nr:Hypothetical protein A7982_01087 [Minicystis rosea]
MRGRCASRFIIEHVNLSFRRTSAMPRHAATIAWSTRSRSSVAKKERHHHDSRASGSPRCRAREAS